MEEDSAKVLEEVLDGLFTDAPDLQLADAAMVLQAWVGEEMLAGALAVLENKRLVLLHQKLTECVCLQGDEPPPQSLDDVSRVCRLYYLSSSPPRCTCGQQVLSAPAKHVTQGLCPHLLAYKIYSHHKAKLGPYVTTIEVSSVPDWIDAMDHIYLSV